MMLNTKINTAANPDRRVNYPILSMTALKMLVSKDIPTKKSNRWITYHYTPTKLPIMEAITNIKIDKNPFSYLSSTQNPIPMSFRIFQKGLKAHLIASRICLNPHI